MTTIPANDHGKVHVFVLSDALATEISQLGSYAGLAAALDATITQPDDIQVVDQATLHDLGLAQFLMLGHGIAEAEIAPEMERLNTLTGSFAIIRSGAFGGQPVNIPEQTDAQWIATFSEQGAAAPPLTPLTSDASKGTITPEAPVKKPKSDARIGGMVATIALLLMGLLVWLMIWVGG